MDLSQYLGDSVNDNEPVSSVSSKSGILITDLEYNYYITTEDNDF